MSDLIHVSGAHTCPSQPVASHVVAAARLDAYGSRMVPCNVADEVPVALLYRGLPYAVLMATPLDLEDLAIGFSVTDGICSGAEIDSVAISSDKDRLALDIRLNAPAFARFLAQRQQRVTRSYTACGLCGIESLDALPSVDTPCPASPIDQAAIRRALHQLPHRQPLSRQTGATHAAAWATPDGSITLVREDVGRHNALDKLIGARIAAAASGEPGFCVVTSRCSYEMVQKAAAAGMGLLACISAPTLLAIRHAQIAGLGLVALARDDNQTVYVGAERVRPAPTHCPEEARP